MQDRVHEFRKTALRELKNEVNQAFLSLLPPGFTAMRQWGMSSFPDQNAAIEYSRAIRGDVINRLPDLLNEFEKNASAKGAKVLWARNAREANAIILGIAKDRGIDYVTKGKSMISEEIGLNEHLIANGVKVYETDLGEVITQQLSLAPFHIVGPAINVAPQDISKKFLESGIITEPTTDPLQLGLAVRMHLREKFKTLKMGVVGVNMAIAETGTFINVENEGNIRLTKSSPKTLVALMSIEKVIPTMADAMHMIRVLSRNCTGQKITSYVSMDTGPKKPKEIDGPEELFIVIVDNGRSEIYKDLNTREVLRCIRCGGCLNACPVYAKIGGYPYGFAYSGPFGQALNPLLLGIGKTSDLYHACTLCGSCKDVCPAGVNHPSLFLDYRAKEIKNKQGLSSHIEKALAYVISWGMSHGWAWVLGAKIMRPLLNTLSHNGYITNIPGGAAGWFTCRDLPAIPAKTFHEKWNDLKNTPAGSSPIRKKEAV